MPSHPNRSKQAPARAANPSPDEIREFRRSRELSAEQAGRLVHSGGRVWRQWEAGERRMHPAFWELAQIKGGAGAGIVRCPGRKGGEFNPLRCSRSLGHDGEHLYCVDGPPYAAGS